MPSSLASVVLGFGLIFAILGLAIPAIVAGGLAVGWELALFVWGGVNDLGA
jgi:hypothetical protein